MKYLQINNRIGVFILSFIAWLLMTSFTNLQEISAGIIVAFLTTLLSVVLFGSSKIRLGFKKVFQLIIYFLILIWEMVKTNFYMVSLILRPKMDLNPGIIKIRTGLRSETALTILANSISLTSGTLTMDVDQANGFIYIQCLRVPGRDVAENTAAIGQRFEKRLREIFE